MFAPGARIVHPEYGDVTDLVIEELVEMSRPQDPVIVEREQAEIAAAAGQEARDLMCGRLVAQIHPDSFNYWYAREGEGFFRDKGNFEKFLRDNPGCRVTSRSPRPKILVDGFRDAPARRSSRFSSAARGGASAADLCCQH